ncbi:MAG: DUF3006 domain-containing protein [Tissierellia bacterium]|nr:DUF3006 domain-containing protein [Tissierellia bacterium]
MKVIVDRFEGSYAVCEDEEQKMINIEIDKLPQGVKEGDVLIIEGDNIKVDKEETEIRRERIRRLMEDLWED